MKQLTKWLLERALSAGLARHIGYEKHQPRNDQGAQADCERAVCHLPSSGRERGRVVTGGRRRALEAEVRADRSAVAEALGASTAAVLVPPTIRKVIYPTKTVESLNMALRKMIKAWDTFPSEETATKLLYLALRNVASNWQHIQGWREALSYFTLLCGAAGRRSLDARPLASPPPRRGSGCFAVLNYTFSSRR
ncbi:MAG: transposase [Bryobacterales bacterium]|nr:transposase [Bryobacterales bacterium]